MYWYLGSPYSKFPGGMEAAYRAVCLSAALLINNKVPVFSPIAHSHSIAVEGDVDPMDHSIWLPADEPLMKAAGGLIVLMMDTWQTSYGLSCEIRHFVEAGKPVVYMTPGVMPELPDLDDEFGVELQREAESVYRENPLVRVLNPLSEGFGAPSSAELAE